MPDVWTLRAAGLLLYYSYRIRTFSMKRNRLRRVFNVDRSLTEIFAGLEIALDPRVIRFLVRNAVDRERNVRVDYFVIGGIFKIGNLHRKTNVIGTLIGILVGIFRIEKNVYSKETDGSKFRPPSFVVYNKINR